MVIDRVMVIAALAILSGCATPMWPFEQEQEIPLDQVPEPVRRAAAEAVPGIRLTEAAVEREDGAEIYELEGMADGEEVELEVSADGRILEIERDG